MQSATANEAMDIRGLSADSRKIAPGYIFAALPGTQDDGRRYIDDAVARGAVAVLAETGTTLKAYDQPVTLLTDPNPRRRLALMAARFYGHQPKNLVAVTGTNGKTSVVEFTRQIWQGLGHKAASLGTLGLKPELPDPPASLTTPDPVDLHRCLANLSSAGFEHLAMEASSHGLDQYRLDGVRVGAAAFTNLSRDHLDYHGSFEAYMSAKARLFDTLLDKDGTAVLNADVPEFERLTAIARDRGIAVMSYGTAGEAVTLIERDPLPDGQRLKIEVLGQIHEIHLPLPAAFQAANALAALGLVLATDAAPNDAVPLLGSLTGVAGRLELAAIGPNGAPIYVDYAHTPDALETVLSALRPHCDGHLHVVFGCGGDRDRGKRPEMGEIATRLADRAIVTDDNPRTEDPAAIRREIMAAAPGATEIGDRRQAIEAAISSLAAGDILVIAGKGHEPGQIVGQEVLPFDDREVAQEAAKRLGGGQK